ncbi:iron transporter, partial [bacterium]
VGATLEEPAEQIFEGISMLLAAGILTWMLFWVRHQARHQRAGIEAQIRGSLAGRPIFWLAFLAVFREGLELALFLLAVGTNSAPLQTLLGALLGIATAALLGVVTFNSSRRLSLRAFFQATNILLLLVAAGLVAHGIHEFVEIGWLPTLIDPLYDVNGILNENSILGSLLKALFGYNGNPSLLEALAYTGYLIVLGLLVSLQPRPARLQSAQ